MNARALPHHRAHAPAAGPAPRAPAPAAAAPATAEPGNLALQELMAAGLRAKLEIGGHDDPEEHAADRMARAVTSGGPAPCACGGTCEDCRAGRPNVLRRKADGSKAPPAAGAIARAFAGPGRPLDRATRADFEPRFGTGLGHVRLHDDSRTASMAETIGARAYAVGSDIGFARGEFSPGTPTGRTLLAHELSHVVLEHGGVRRAPVGPVPSAPSDKDDTPAHPAGSMAYFRGVPVADDAEFMRGILRRLIADVGLAQANRWYGHFMRGDRGSPMPLPIMAHTMAFRRPVRSPLDAERDRRDEILWNDARETVGRVYGEVREEALAFLRTFEAKALEVTRDILATSEARAESERVRYGLDRQVDTIEKRHKDEFGVWVSDYETRTTDTMQNQLPGQALAGAAQDLLAKRAEINGVRAAQGRLEKTRCFKGECYETIPPENAAEHKRLGEQATAKEGEYALLKGVYQERYPILARIADDHGALTELAKGPSAKAAAVLNDQIYGTLDNIRDVRAQLGGKVNVWKLPEIVALTKAGLGVQADTSIARMQNRMVDDHAQEVQDDASFREKVLMALTIGLALVAAIPSGGSSLMAGAAAIAGMGAFTLSAIQAGEHLEQYMLDRAMAGTDFDRAKALAASDPSLFWLAVDIVGAIADLGPAAKGAKAMFSAGRSAFTSLAGVARRLTITEGADAARALAELRSAAAAAEGTSGITGLAGRVIASAESVSKAGGSVEKALGKAAGHEAAAVARGTASLTGKGVVTVSSKFGGEIKMTSLGIFSCASPCSLLREKYLAELVVDKKLADKLLTIEREAIAAAGNSSELAKIGQRASALEGELRLVPRDTFVSPLKPAAAGKASVTDAAKASAEFDALVKRRGSVAFELDRRPPDWHGVDEAAFRYGDKAKAEVGYFWRLDADGGLHYVRKNTSLPERIFDPVSGTFRAPDAAPLRVALESDEELTKLAAAGAKATSQAEWLASIRKGVPSTASLSDEALLRVMRRSPNLDHMRGELLEALSAKGLGKRAAAAGGEFVEGSRVTDAAGRQLSDGLVIRRTGADRAEVLAIGESKAGEGAAAGLSAEHTSFSSLKPGAKAYEELEIEAIDRLRQQLGVEEVTKGSPYTAANLRKTHKAEIEAIMRDVNTRDIGQIERDFERMMPNFGARDTVIRIDGKPVRVTVNRARTKLVAIAPTDVGLEAAVQTGKSAGITVEALDVGIDSATLEAVARQLRAEQIKNGARLK